MTADRFLQNLVGGLGPSEGLANNQRITLHFTPTSGSWLNLVEVFFGIVTRQAIRRGSFDSLKELTAAIDRFIDACNERPVWSRRADHGRARQPAATA